MRVYKYELMPHLAGSEATILLPAGAVIVHVDIQDRALRLWALVDEALPADEERHIVVLGTGHRAPEGTLKPINSFLAEGGHYVFHGFEKLS